MKNAKAGAYAVLALLISATAWASLSPGGLEAGKEPPQTLQALEATWGVRIEGVNLSAGGYILDFRYRVLDAGKAAPLTAAHVKPYLVHERTGARLMVPAPGKVGPLRNTVRNGPPKEGSVHFVLFVNPGKMVENGEKVTVAIGDFEAKGLAVGNSSAAG